MRRFIIPLLLSGSLSAGAAEPWADPQLPVKDGLELWLDASRQREAAQEPVDRLSELATVGARIYDADLNPKK